MMLRPQGWVVRYRLGWFDRLLLGYGAFVGLFFAVVCFGGLASIITRTLDGTLLPPAERTAGAIVLHAAIALFALWFGGVTLRWSFGSLFDLLGAEVVLYGPIEALTAHRGAKGRRYTAVVAGGTVELTAEVFETLSKGDRVWMRVGRFQRSLEELARPDRFVPVSAPAPAGEQAVAPPLPVTGPQPGAPGPIPDHALRPSDVPAPSAPWTDVERFALTYEGATGPAIFDLAERHGQADTLPETLTELRAILYVEQRRHRHWMRRPSGEALSRVRAIVEAIRARVPRED